MYTSIKVKNFRGFRDLTVEPLERVNLIAGANNVGKTALLEAICLIPPPSNESRTAVGNLFRGVNQTSVGAEDIQRWLFLNGETSNDIELVGIKPDGERESVRIRRHEAELVLDYRDDANGQGYTYVELGPAGSARVKVLYSQNWGSSVISFIPSGGARSPDIDLFSRLAMAKRQPELVDALRILDPRLTQLSLLNVNSVSIIHADIGIERLIPVEFMGEGSLRVLALVLAIANVPGGIVLVDEIENGLHHSVMAKVWQAVANAARLFSVQIFATTHSWECIQAAHKAFMKSERYDFRLHRLDRIDGDIRAVTYDQETLEAALTAELEVR